MRAFIKLVANTFFLTASAGWAYLGYHTLNKYGFNISEHWLGYLIMFAGFGSCIAMMNAVGEWLAPAIENNEMTIFDRIQATEAAEKG
jgi:hypothetical protein